MFVEEYDRLVPGDAGNDTKIPVLLDRKMSIFKLSMERGIDPEQAFKLLDIDGGGNAALDRHMNRGKTTLRERIGDLIGDRWKMSSFDPMFRMLFDTSNDNLNKQISAAVRDRSRSHRDGRGARYAQRGYTGAIRSRAMDLRE